MSLNKPSFLSLGFLSTRTYEKTVINEIAFKVIVKSSHELIWERMDRVNWILEFIWFTAKGLNFALLILFILVIIKYFASLMIQMKKKT
jgi:hypothetical protein